MPYDDLMQELSIVFMKAYELHDPEQSKFSTYFTYAAYNRINRIAEDQVKEKVRLGMHSVESIFEPDADDEDVYNLFPCDRMNPEETLMAKRLAIEIQGKLSSLAALIVDWLADPPTFVIDELNKVLAHSEYAKTLGYNKRAVAKLNMNFVCDVMVLVSDVTQTEVNSAKRELRAIAERCGNGYAR